MNGLSLLHFVRHTRSLYCHPFTLHPHPSRYAGPKGRDEMRTGDNKTMNPGPSTPAKGAVNLVLGLSCPYGRLLPFMSSSVSPPYVGSPPGRVMNGSEERRTGGTGPVHSTLSLFPSSISSSSSCPSLHSPPRHVGRLLTLSSLMPSATR